MSIMELGALGEFLGLFALTVVRGLRRRICYSARVAFSHLGRRREGVSRAQPGVMSAASSNLRVLA